MGMLNLTLFLLVLFVYLACLCVCFFYVCLTCLTVFFVVFSEICGIWNICLGSGERALLLLW